MDLNSNDKKILLVLLPFWTPLIPPLGISCLKSFLQGHGFDVKTVDANVEIEFVQVYDRYFDTLREYIPAHKRGNFLNIGIDVLQNHMSAFIHRGDGDGYLELLGTIVGKTFFFDVEVSQVQALDHIVAEFYRRLEHYFLQLLEKEKPGVLGISVYKGTFAPSMFAFRLAKETYPGIKTVMGGGIFSDQLALGSPNFDFFIQKTSHIDHVVVGEGELLFLELLTGRLPSSQKVLTRESPGGGVLDISTVDVPDFSDFDTGFYSSLAAYTSRSCPFQCAFCAETVNWGNYRKKKASQVLEELTRLYRVHGTQLFLMCDSILNPIVTDLARAFTDSEIALYWDGYLKVDSRVCDGENTFLWRRGGFYRARLGIESGSPATLEAMDKKITPGQIRTALANLAHAGIKTSTYWVVGFPGETEEDFLQTLDLIEELKDDIYEAEANPFRYYPVGQVNSGEWSQKNKSRLLYPENAADKLVLRTWILENAVPGREEIYSRLSRFVRHCNKLGIPNPYSWKEINGADERWKKLHPNAVPPLIEFKNRNYIEECKTVENLLMLQNIPRDDDDFDFL